MVAVVSTKRKRTTCNGPPRLKRKYTWKGGVAPKRRLGHVRREDNANNEEEEEEVNRSSEDDWMDDDDDSVLLDDDSTEEEESENEDVQIGEGSGVSAEAPVFDADDPHAIYKA